MLEKLQYCQNNPVNSYTEKKSKLKLSGYAGVQYAHLMIQKTNSIFIEERIALKSYVKI